MTTQSFDVGHERGQGAAADTTQPPVPPTGVPGAVAVMARAGSENFTVASRLLPARHRRHLLAIYGFARFADDIGDEAEGDRVAALDWLEGELQRAATGSATHPLLRELTPTLRECSLPLDPFVRLIEANRQDQVVRRYATYRDLLAYCELSANPVGELVLRVFGAATPDRLARSDRVCSGLQIVEHLQDIGEDHRRSRVYLPLDDLARHDCPEQDLGAASASPPLRAVVHDLARRARALLDAAAPLLASLRGRERLAVAGYAAGGLAALDAITAAGGDVLGVRCRPRPARVAAHVTALLRAAREGAA